MKDKKGKPPLLSTTGEGLGDEGETLDFSTRI
jgi:hypothetical protein